MLPIELFASDERKVFMQFLFRRDVSMVLSLLMGVSIKLNFQGPPATKVDE